MLLLRRAVVWAVALGMSLVTLLLPHRGIRWEPPRALRSIQSGAISATGELVFPSLDNMYKEWREKGALSIQSRWMDGTLSQTQWMMPEPDATLCLMYRGDAHSRRHVYIPHPPTGHWGRRPSLQYYNAENFYMYYPSENVCQQLTGRGLYPVYLPNDPLDCTATLANDFFGLYCAINPETVYAKCITWGDVMALGEAGTCNARQLQKNCCVRTLGKEDDADAAPAEIMLAMQAANFSLRAFRQFVPGAGWTLQNNDTDVPFGYLFSATYLEDRPQTCTLDFLPSVGDMNNAAWGWRYEICESADQKAYLHQHPGGDPVLAFVCQPTVINVTRDTALLVINKDFATRDAGGNTVYKMTDFQGATGLTVGGTLYPLVDVSEAYFYVEANLALSRFSPGTSLRASFACDGDAQ
jgi:hypothetical protein